MILSQLKLNKRKIISQNCSKAFFIKKLRTQTHQSTNISTVSTIEFNLNVIFPSVKKKMFILNVLFSCKSKSTQNKTQQLITEKIIQKVLA